MELYEADLRYEFEVPELGRRFGDEVERVIQRLLERPTWARALTRALRHFVLRKFPFSVVYSVAADLIYIVAIAHGSREPEYWRSRVQDR